MAKKIKASELTAELKNYMDASKKPKTSENTNGGLSDELKSFLDNRKESGTLLSGALSDDEKQYYADKTAATKKQLYVASEREEAAKRAKVAEKKATTPTVDNVDTFGEKVSDNIGYLFDNAITGFQNSVDSLKGVVGAARESVTPTLYSLFDTKELGETGAKMVVGLRKRTAPTLKTYKERTENGLGDYSNPVSAAKTTFSDEISQNLTDFYANESKSEERLQQLEEKYSDADIKSVTKFIGDAAYSGGYATASTVASMMTGGLAGPIVMATQSYGDAFNDAIKSGATRSEALEYAAREAINQGALDALFSPAGGFGEDLLMKGVSKATANPAVKTAVNYTVNALGEGVEEIAQSLVSTHNQRQTYDPDAEVDASDLLREGALGAFSGGVYGAMNIPSQVHEYTLEENKAKYEASTPERRKMLNDAANSDETNAVENLVSLLKNVGENGSAEESVKKTIDLLTDEIKASNHILSTSKDVAVIERTKAERQNYMDMADAIRENKKSIIKILQKEAGDSVSSEADTNAVSSDVSEPVESASTGDTVQLSAENAMPLAEQETAKKNTPLRTDERIRRSSSTTGADIYFESLATTAVEDLTVEDVVDAVQAARAKFPEQNPVDSILNRLNDRIESMRESENALSNPDLKETMRLQRERLETVEAYVRNNRAEIMANAMEANAVPVDVSQENIPQSDTSDENLARPSDEMEEAPAAAEAKSAKATDSAVPDGELRNAYDFLDDSDDVYASLDIYNAGDTEEAVNELLRHNGGLKGAVDAVRERIADLKKSGENTSEAEIKALEEIDSEIRKLAKPIANRATRVLNDSFKKMGIDARVVVDQSLAFDLSGNKPVTNASYDPKTNTIHVSPYATEFDAIASYVVHEMTHQAKATGDGKIIGDLLKAKKLLEDKGAFKGYTREQIERGYSDQVAGRTEADKKAFLDEEEAAYFLQSLLENRGGAFDALTRENRGLLQRIVDAIKDFFDRNGRKDRAVQRLIEKLESLANEAVAEAERTERRAKASEVSVDTRATSDNAGVESGEEINEETEETGEDAEPLKPLEPLEDLTPGEDGVVYSEDGEPVADSAEDGSVRLSISLYDAEGRSEFRKFLNKSVASGRLTKEDARDMFDSIEEIYQICSEFKDKYAPFSTWSDAEVVRDTHGRPVFSVVTPNGEYKMNLDFSLVCKKRRTLDAVFNEMARRGIIDDFELGQKSVVKINEIIRNHGFETACALCFVDAKRFRQASMADQFVSLYNELVESLVPDGSRESIGYFNFSGNTSRTTVENGIDTWANGDLDFSHLDYVMKKYGKGTVEYKSARYIKNHPEARKLLQRGDFMSSGGFDAVKSQNPAIMKLYNSKKGTGGPKAAFGDVQYMNEIIKKAKTWTPEKAYSVGGIRIQSFSDYVPRLVFDYVQMIHDLAAVGLPAHAYTKEVLFAKQFGKTGIKINLSLIPAVSDGGIAPGLDADGNYVWAGESIDYDEAVAIQNADGYTENCGTICVGVSDEHIRKLLADPNIRMVIPYHKSGLNPIVAHMNKIDAFKDYTGSQNTLDENGKKLSEEFDFNKALRETGDPKKAVERYLEWVDKNGYTAKFNEFRGDPNYYKLLEDFTLFDRDGRYVPQRSVRAEFPKDGDAFGSMRSLIESGLQEDAVIEGKRDSELGNIVDEIERALPKTEAEIEETAVKQADGDVERDIRESRELDEEYMSDLRTNLTDGAAKISDGMSDDKRYDILKNRVIQLKARTDYAKMLDIADEIEEIETLQLTEKKKLLRQIAEQFGVFKGYQNADIELEFEYSRGGLKESVQKQRRNYYNFTKLLSCFDDVIDSAVGIEVHNRNGEYKTDPDLKNVYVLVGAFVDGDNIVPVKLEVKEFNAAKKANTLYVSIALGEIKKDRIVTMSDSDTSQKHVAPLPVISIADLFANVNTSDGGFLKYIPDGFLDQTQRDAKSDYIERERALNEKTGTRYSRELETESERKIRRQQEKIEYLEKQARSHTAFGLARTVSVSAREKFAKKIAADIPGVSADRVSVALKEVWDIAEEPRKNASDTPEARYKRMQEKAHSVISELVSESTENRLNPMYEEYSDLRNTLRTTAIRKTISEAEFGGAEDYKAWRKQNIGLLRINDSESALPIDTFYQELSAKYPEFFPPDIDNEADQMKRLGETAVILKRIAGSKTEKVNPLEDVAETYTQDLVNMVLAGYFDISKHTQAAKSSYADAKNASDVKRAYAEGQADAARREAAAYQEGVNAGMQIMEEEYDSAFDEWEQFYMDANTALRESWERYDREVERLNRKIDSVGEKLTAAKNRSNIRDLNLSRMASQKTFNAYLKQIHKMLLAPTKRNHVPEQLKGRVAEYIRRFDELGLAGNVPAMELIRDMARVVGDNEIPGEYKGTDIAFAEHFNTIMNIADGYRKAIEDITPEVFAADPKKAEMDLIRLQNAYYKQCIIGLKMIKHQIMEADRVFMNGKNFTAEIFGSEIISDMKARKKYDSDAPNTEFSDVVKQESRSYARKSHYEACSFDTFAKMMGNSGVAIADRARYGQTLQQKRVHQYAEYISDVIGDKYSTQEAGGVGGNRIPVSIDGVDVDVSRAQLMSLRCLWNRPAARRHLMLGGACFLTSNGREYDSRTIKLTEKSYNELMTHLSAEDKRIADAIQKFLAKECGEWGNEATMYMYGYRMYEDSNYFMIRAKGTTLNRESVFRDTSLASLENASFSKSLKQGASNAIVIGDIFSEAERHVKHMAAYSAYAPVSNDMTRILRQPGVREAIERGMGADGMAYLSDFLKRLNNAEVEESGGSQMYGLFSWIGNMAKRNAVAFSFSTMMKQYLSGFSAWSEINPKYLNPKYLLHTSGSKNRDGKFGMAYREMVEHSGVAKIKTLGYSDTNFGKTLREQYDSQYVKTGGAVRNILTSTGGGRNVVKAYDKVAEWGMMGAAEADIGTMVMIWEGCKAEVRDTRKDISREELLRLAAVKFNRVMGRTQVVGSLIDSPPLTQKLMNSGWGAFMNEPIKTYSRLMEAVDGIKNGRSGARKQLAVTATSVIVSNVIMEPLMSALFSMLRDDEDDTDQFFRKLWKNLTGFDYTDGKSETSVTSVLSSNIVDGIVGIIPAFGEIYGFVLDTIQGYSSARFETENAEKAINSIASLFSQKESAKTGYKKLIDAVGAVSALFGIPVNTLKRDLGIIPKLLMNATDNYELRWGYNKLFYNISNGSALSQKNFYEIMKQAINHGDTEAYKKMLSDLTDVVRDTPSVIDFTSMRDILKEKGAEEAPVGSEMWCIETQARFYLDNYVKGNKVENFLAATYRIALKAGMAEDDIKTKLLLSMPESSGTFISTEKPDGKYSYKEIEPEDKKGPVFYRIDSVGYEEYIHDVGLLSYKVLTELRSSSNQRAWDSLTPGQQVYAINKVYDYAKSIYKSEYDSDYNGLENWMKDLHKKKAGQAEIASAVIALAKSKDK